MTDLRDQITAIMRAGDMSRASYDDVANAIIAIPVPSNPQARIAELEATVKHYLGAITDAAGGAPDMQRPAQIALLKLQAVIDWPTKGNGDAIRAALGDGV